MLSERCSPTCGLFLTQKNQAQYQTEQSVFSVDGALVLSLFFQNTITCHPAVGLEHSASRLFRMQRRFCDFHACLGQRYLPPHLSSLLKWNGLGHVRRKGGGCCSSSVSLSSVDRTFVTVSTTNSMGLLGSLQERLIREDTKDRGKNRKNETIEDRRY